MNYKNFLLAILSGIFLILSFPKFNLYPLIFIAFIPLFYAISNFEKSYFKKFLLGLITGFVFYIGLLRWVVNVRRIEVMGIPAWIALSLFEALYFGFFTLGISFFITSKNNFIKTFFPAFFFVILEYIKGQGILGFPWGSICYSQYLNIPLIQISEFTGMYGVSFLIILFNSSLVFCKKKSFSSVLILFLLFLSFFYGILKIHQPLPTPKIKVAILQGNTQRDVQWTGDYENYLLEFYKKLSLKSKKFNPQIIVWPESVFAYSSLNNIDFLIKLKNIAKEIKTILVVGCFDEIGKENFNASVVFSPNGEVLGKYYKTHLVLFGEFIPFKELFKKFNYNPWGEGSQDLSFGKHFVVVNTKAAKIGFNICFETIFPYITREMVKKDAEIIIAQIAESWFKEDTTYQHTPQFIFRAVENRIYLVRCADVGISCFVDPYGRIMGKTSFNKEEILISKIDKRREKTFYSKYGDIFVLICLIFNLIFLKIFIYEKRK